MQHVKSRLPATARHQREIEAHARSYGLDFWAQLRGADYKRMQEVPLRRVSGALSPLALRHGFDRLSKSHVRAVADLRDVINNNPAYAYLLEEIHWSIRRW